MYNYVLGLFVLFLFSCNLEKTATTSEAEKEMIKALVTDETLAYMEKDYEKWASFGTMAAKYCG